MEQRSSLGAAQLGKKFPAFHSQQLIYILSQFNLSHTHTLFILRIILIRSSHLRLDLPSSAHSYIPSKIWMKSVFFQCILRIPPI